MRSGFEVTGAETGHGPLPDDELNLLRSIEGKAAIAEMLFRQGRFDDAFLLYQDVATEAPWHRRTHVSIAAILADRGENRKARELLRSFYAAYPLSDPEAGDSERPTVLRIRGFDATRILLTEGDDGWKPRFRGGHFATKFLIESSECSLRTFTISRDNILLPGAVPDHELIVNTIAEPDIEGRSLDALEKWLGLNPGATVINRPERVRETARDINWQRLREYPGIGFPRTIRLPLAGNRIEHFAETLGAQDFSYPFILREAGTQTARSTALIENDDDLGSYARNATDRDHFAIDYHPILWRGEFFRKLRLFHIDGEYYPVVCHLDRCWNVHGNNRKEVMRPRQDLIDEEKSFLADWRGYVGHKNADRLDGVAFLIDLDFFGIDFTLDSDEQLFIYELNPAMRHSFDHAENFPYKIPYDQAITEAFTRMIERRLGSRT